MGIFKIKYILINEKTKERIIFSTERFNNIYDVYQIYISELKKNQNQSHIKLVFSELLVYEEDLNLPLQVNIFKINNIK